MLLKLIRDNLERPKARLQPKIVKNDAGEDEATIYLYDAIGAWFGVPAADFVQQLNAIKEPVVHLRINSPGGEVFDARAIATAIQQHPSKIVAHVDGLAASCASWIATAADEVEMSDGAFFMIHNSWTICMGNAADLAHEAGVLQKIDQSIVNDYMKKTGKSQADVEAWMNAETWFTAQEAKAAGFADRIDVPDETDQSDAENAWNLGAYKNVPPLLKEPKKQPQPQYDRAALERRFKLYERIAA